MLCFQIKSTYTLLPCCIFCCSPAPQAVLKRFRRELLAVEQQQRIEQGNKVSRFYLKTYHFFSLLRKTFVNVRL